MTRKARWTWLLATVLAVGCGGSDGAEGDGETTGGGMGPGGSTGGPSGGQGGFDGAGGGGASTASGSGASSGAGAGAPTWGEDQCPAPPPGVTVGTEVGQQLPSLTVYDCDGNPVSLDAFCGAEAMFLFAMHTWCPICQNVSSKIEALHDGYAGYDLATAVVIVADSGGGAPTAADCQAVRSEHGHQDVATFYDPDGVVEAIWGGSSSLSAYLDADRVITGKLVYEGSTAAIEGEIDKALGL